MIDLRQIVIEEIDASDEADPRTVAKAVMNRLEPDEFRDVAEKLLPDYVRSLFRTDRRNPPTAVVGEGDDARPSKRWAAAKDAYQSLLRQRLFIGSEWKLLRDCTADDLFAASALRRDQAARDIAWADKYDALARKMRRAKAGTVADMPSEIVVGVIG